MKFTIYFFSLLFLTLFLTAQSHTSTDFKCPVLKLEHISKACWEKDKRAEVQGRTIYGVKCPSFGWLKRQQLKLAKMKTKVYLGTFIGRRSPNRLSRADPICSYSFHILGRKTQAHIAVIDPFQGTDPSLVGSDQMPEGIEFPDESLEPFLPYDALQGPMNTNQVTPLSLKNTDRAFIEQTGGGIERAIGTGKLLLLVREQYVYENSIQHMDLEERQHLAKQLFLEFYGEDSDTIRTYLQTKQVSVDDLEYLYETVKKEIFETYNWSVTKKIWNNADEPLDEQFRKEAVIFLNTLYPAEEKVRKIRAIPDQEEFEARKLDFLKRIFIALPFIKYSPEENANPNDMKEWPFPIASVLGRGGRVLIVAEDKNIKPHFRYFLYGPKPPPPNQKLLYFRRPSEKFGLSFDRRKGYVIERDLRGIQRLPQMALRRMLGYDLGFHIPVGGLGSPESDGLLVGINGLSLDPITGKKIRKNPKGNMYMNYNQSVGAFVIGFSLPQKGARSIAGGKPWNNISDYKGHKSPHAYGGKRLILTKRLFNTIRTYGIALFKRPLSEQREVFKKLLTLSGPEAQDYLQKTVESILYKGAPSIEELLDPSTPSGLNLENVHKRQIILRKKGNAADVSTSIVLLQGQAIQEERGNTKRQEIEKQLQEARKQNRDTSALEQQLQGVMMKLDAFEKVRKKAIAHIKSVLNLTDKQIASIPDLNTYKNANNR